MSRNVNQKVPILLSAAVSKAEREEEEGSSRGSRILELIMVLHTSYVSTITLMYYRM